MPTIAFVATVVAGIAIGLVALRRVLPRLSDNRAAFERRVPALLAVPRGSAGVVEDVDLARLPAPVRRFLVRADVVGRPRVRTAAIRFHGTIRSGPAAA